MPNVKLNTALRCPLCGAALETAGGSLTCHGARRHNFDIAKSGYVNFNTHLPTSGDDKAMAAARQAFLRRGYYAPLAKAIAAEAGTGKLLADAGCGEGYYTESVSSGFDFCLGADLSKYALALAAKSASAKGLSDKLLYTAASVYELPLRDGVCDCVMNVFAPCVEKEYSRVLCTGGKLVVAAAGRDHLYGLKEKLYDTVIPNEVRRDLPTQMRLEKTVPVQYDVTIDGADLLPLFMMTPYYYRTPKERAERLLTLETLKTVLDFEIRVYIKEK